MKLLYYENLNDIHLSQIRKAMPGKLGVFRDYLRVSEEHIKEQTLEVKWKIGVVPDTYQEETDHGVWLEISGINEDLSEAQLKTLFESGSLSKIYEKSPEEELGSYRYNPDNALEVFYQDRDSEQILVDRFPTSGFTLFIRPNTYVIHKQIEAIRQLQDRPSEYHSPLLRLFDRVEKAKWPEALPSTDLLEWQFLTDSNRPGTDQQRQFVRQALGTPDFALLEGPPGSGKTTAICELIAQAIRQNQRILLCASTHVAIDNVIERLMTDLNKAEEIIPIRIGDEFNVSDIVRRFTLKNFKDSERKRIREYINNLENPTDVQKEWSKLLSQNPGQDDELQTIILDSANLICGTTIGILKHPEIYKSTKMKRTEPLYDMLIIDEASKTTFQEFLVPALLAKKWILVGDPQQLSPYVDSDELAANLAQILPLVERNAAFDVFSASQHNRNYRSALIQCPADERTEIAEIYRSFAQEKDIEISTGIGKDTELADILLLTPDEIDNFSNSLPLDLSILREVSNDQIIKQARAWTSRKHNPSPKWEDEISWRILRLYEQRMASGSKVAENLRSVIEELIPEPRKNVLQRDIEGLSRIAIPSVLECLQKGISRDKKKNGIGYHDPTFLTDGLPAEVKQKRYTLLKYQQRMHPGISEFPRRFVYQNQALNDPPEMEASRVISSPLRYPNRSHWLHVNSGYSKNGNFNEKEADLIINELIKLGEWKQTTNSAINSVAIITFYRGQERLLRTRLRQLTGEMKNYRNFHYLDLKIELCTVDRFQGHEADIVYLSFANRYPTNFLQSPNRLNVAITRAKYQLVIVGNRSALARCDEESILYKLCEYHSQKVDYHYGE